MELFGEVTSLNSIQDLYFPDFGLLKPGETLVIDEYKMIRIEAKRKCKIGEIKFPYNVEFVLVVKDDDEEE